MYMYINPHAFVQAHLSTAVFPQRFSFFYSLLSLLSP